MNCEKCKQPLSEYYMICRNCGEPRKPLDTWETRLWKHTQAEIARLEAACIRKDKLLEVIIEKHENIVDVLKQPELDEEALSAANTMFLILLNDVRDELSREEI